MLILTDITFTDIVSFAIAWSVIFAWTLTIFFIIKWWIQMILAWNWEDVEAEKAKAWWTIRYAIIWLFIVWFAVAVVHLAWNFMWLDFLKYLDYNQIMKMFNLIIRRLSWDYSDQPDVLNSWTLDF